MVGFRAARSSRLASGLALAALIAVAALSVALIESRTLADPLQRNLIRPADAPLPETGVLLVRMFSNQDFRSVVSAPLNTSVPVPRYPMEVITINSSVVSEAPLSLTTNADGVANKSLLPGVYVLRVPYNTLRIAVPVRILSGNTTSVSLNVSEGAYPLIYTEAADVGGEPSVYVEVLASAPAANVTEPVTLQVQSRGSPEGYQVYATVVYAQQPTQGTQWLELRSLGAFDFASVSTVFLATWTYTSSITVAPTVPSAGLPA